MLIKEKRLEDVFLKEKIVLEVCPGFYLEKLDVSELTQEDMKISLTQDPSKAVTFFDRVPEIIKCLPKFCGEAHYKEIKIDLKNGMWKNK